MKEPVIKLMQGNEACTEAALVAGCSFYAGYPITPSTEIAELMAERLPIYGGRFIQMEDEIASMAAIIGASLTGAKSLTATSGPGFSLKQENIGYASLTEVPVVIVNVQRVGPSTGMATSPAQGDVMQARWGTHGDHPIVVLAPSSVQETYEVTIEAFNIAEELRVPVILLLDEVIGHMREKIVIPDRDSLKITNRKKTDARPEDFLPYKADEDGVPPMADFGTGYRTHVTGLFHDETGFPTGDPKKADALLRRLHEKLDKAKDRITLVEEIETEDADIVLFAYGSSARPALSALRQARALGIKVGLIKPITIWPFPEEVVDRVAKKAKTIIVPEMNLGQLIREVERASRGQADVIGLNRVDGELFKPEEILEKIKEVS